MSKKRFSLVMIIAILVVASVGILVLSPDDWFSALSGKSTSDTVIIEDINSSSGGTTTAVSVLLNVKTKMDSKCTYAKSSSESIKLGWKDFANTGEKEHSTPIYLDLGQNSYELRCYRLSNNRYQKRNWNLRRDSLPSIKCKEYLETGKSYFEYGYIEEETKTVSNFYYDQCTNNKKNDQNDLTEVMEYYCKDGKVAYEYYECPDLCRSGACQTPPKA